LILKMFSQKNGKRTGDFDWNFSCLGSKKDRKILFLEKRPFFSQKVVKNWRKNDHNIDPLLFKTREQWSRQMWHFVLWLERDTIHIRMVLVAIASLLV
jgi:hypothetical protein